MVLPGFCSYADFLVFLKRIVSVVCIQLGYMIIKIEFNNKINFAPFGSEHTNIVYTNFKFTPTKYYDAFN